MKSNKDFTSMKLSQDIANFEGPDIRPIFSPSVKRMGKNLKLSRSSTLEKQITKGLGKFLWEEFKDNCLLCVPIEFRT